MSYQRPVSAVAASRERSGFNHIGRLVELWLARYESLEAANRKMTSQRIAKRRLAKPSRNHGSTASSTRKIRTAQNAVIANGNVPVAVGEVQNTFGFYQPTE